MNPSSDLRVGNDKPGSLNRRELLKVGTSLVAATTLAKTATAAGGAPNILVIFGDDIGYWDISAYNRGMMGYRTPNIDRIAKEGAIFTDLYAQQSCTAGRAAFITGQSCFRTGLLKVGLPGAPTPSKRPSSTPASTTNGASNAPPCSSHRKLSWAST